MAGIEKLSALKALKETKPGRYSDGGNLYLNIGRPAGRTFVFLYKDRVTGKPKEMGIGPAKGPGRKDGLSLVEARDKAAAARQMLRNGIDPLSAKRAAVPASMTFGQLSDEYLATVVAAHKNPVHRAQWRSTLDTYAAALMPMRLSEIETRDVLAVLQPIWGTKQETADRVRQRIKKILDAAKAKKLVVGDNPAAWEGNLKELLGSRTTGEREHHAAVPFDEMPAFMTDLRSRESTSALALEYTILTAARTGETIGARWGEIDLNRKNWTVPASRMKAKREHQVPLSDRAVEILQSLKPPDAKDDEYIFPGNKRGLPLSNMAMLECLRNIRKGVTVHGFRSSFRDWAGDHTSFPREITEAALAHVIKDKAEAAYRRRTALEKRRKLMMAWQQFLGTGNNVISLAR